MTQNGKIIFDIIIASSDHLTAEQIYQRLLDSSIKMSLATIYNNLNALHQEGYIQKIVTEGQPDRYDKAHRHDHLICKDCGKIEDLNLEDLTRYLASSTEVDILSYDLKLFYLCNECKAKQEKSNPSRIKAG